MRNNIWVDGLEDIRKVFGSKLTESEFQFFVGLGKATGLDPFRKEIWCIKYDPDAAAQIFIGRDGYRMIALSHPDYDYYQSDSVYEKDNFQIINGEIHHDYSAQNRGNLLGAYCIAKRKSSSKPFYSYVKIGEYKSSRPMWTSKPDMMIKKCAEATALRAAFPDELNGTYIPEEMPDEIISQSEKNHKKMTNEAISQPEKIPQKIINELKVSENRLNELKELILQKDIQNDRIKKALDYYQIQDLSELSEKQAEFVFNRWAAL